VHDELGVDGGVLVDVDELLEDRLEFNLHLLECPQDGLRARDPGVWGREGGPEGAIGPGGGGVKFRWGEGGGDNPRREVKTVTIKSIDK